MCKSSVALTLSASYLLQVEEHIAVVHGEMQEWIDEGGEAEVYGDGTETVVVNEVEEVREQEIVADQHQMMVADDQQYGYYPYEEEEMAAPLRHVRMMTEEGPVVIAQPSGRMRRNRLIRSQSDRPHGARNLDWIIDAVAKGLDVDSASPHNRRKPVMHKCQYCGRVDKYPSKIKAHMRTHTGEKPFKCEICGMTFAQRTPMRLHVRRHLDQKPYICTIEGCDLRFVSGALLNYHQQTKHFMTKRYICLKGCGRFFASARNQRNHEARCFYNTEQANDFGDAIYEHLVYNDQEEEEASENEEALFQAEEELEEALEAVETSLNSSDNRNMQEMEVDAATIEMAAPLRHVRMMTEEGPVVIAQPSGRMRRNRLIRSQSDRPHGARNLDWIIDAVAKGLDVDSASPHNRRKPVMHKCQYCGRVDKYPSKIKAHMRTHTGEKPFKCEICGMTFAQRTPMRLHVRRHLDQKPYICTIEGCDLRFVSGALLNYHQQTKHFMTKRYICLKGCGRFFASARNQRNHEARCFYNTEQANDFGDAIYEHLVYNDQEEEEASENEAEEELEEALEAVETSLNSSDANPPDAKTQPQFLHQ
ncbi:zinc finger, C2H2 type [Ancylostoma duodenale]|uniref:Zinc finger, C2H2 type n=1 Tax=Ancylostoma duodenale TaxID=51022 RepID=A0A0C2CXB1_9BILA|nr:zinc finger, C2H2 type [Ancylostoma duodenale]